MIYNYKEILDKYKTDYNIKKAIEKKEIYKIDNGIYSEHSNINYLEKITKKYPYGVICGLSAYYFYGFTDVIPEVIELSTVQNTTRINNPEIKQIRMKDELYKLGITKYEYEGVLINIYNKERLLIDLARNKNQIGYDLYKEIVSNYRKIVDNLNMNLIDEYLTFFSDNERIYQTLMNEVF